jgi:hypothetical protein
MRPRKALCNEWITMFQSVRMTDREDGRRLGCIVNGQGTTCLAVAVETTTAAGSMAAVLAEHSH